MMSYLSIIHLFPSSSYSIPLPNWQSSFPPSPYMIINHKACGPGLLKSDSEVDAPFHPKTLSEEKFCDCSDVNSTQLPISIIESIKEDNTTGVLTQSIHDHEGPVWDCSPPHGTYWNNKSVKDLSNTVLECGSCLLEPIRSKADKDCPYEGFYNTEIEDDSGTESSYKFGTPCGEFYDVNNNETEQREIRLSLLMEIEKRKQTEEILEQMQVHWWRLRQQLADVGLFLPLDPTRSQYSINVADELRCQIEVARLANAEVEMELESEVKAKNFEITRLSKRLHYYETVNQEMCQRNQETIEVARQERLKKKRRQKWIWGSIAATIMLGSAVLAWSYLHASILSSDVAQPQCGRISSCKITSCKIEVRKIKVRVSL